MDWVEIRVRVGILPTQLHTPRRRRRTRSWPSIIVAGDYLGCVVGWQAQGRGINPLLGARTRRHAWGMGGWVGGWVHARAYMTGA